MTLLTLPDEILTHVLIHLEPRDIIRIGTTCHQLQAITKPSNNFLWHSAFLQVFDDPQHARSLVPQAGCPLIDNNDEQSSEYWYSQIRRRMYALESVAKNARGSFNSHKMSAEEVIETLLDMIDTAKPGPTKSDIAQGILPMVDDRRSLNLQHLIYGDECWTRLENLIHDCHTADAEGLSEVTGRPVTRSVSIVRRHTLRSEAASRLHVLYGRTFRERIEHGQKGMARSIVYSWSNPHVTNDYGPFKKDNSGDVDWKVLEACASVMLRHFEMGADGQIVIPQGFYYSFPHRTLIDPTVPDDWARVTGRWFGTYSFLNYSDLFAYNTGTYSPTDLEDLPETHGDLMMLDLKLDMERSKDTRLHSTLPCSSDMPTLYFSGNSRPFDQYDQPRLLINVFGSVSLCTNRREVRWRYIFSYRGQEQWVLEGIQPGGIRSGSIFGLWTQWGHDDHSPVGSFMYVPEELCKRQELVLLT